MVRRLLNFLRKPNPDLPDGMQVLALREMDDTEGIHEDFRSLGLSVVILRPDTGVQEKVQKLGPYTHPEKFSPGGYL